jgi:hypothetical protein
MRHFLIATAFILHACSPGPEQPAPPSSAPAPAPVAAPAKTPLPKKATTILFNTPEADAILSTLQVFPKDNPWNEDISERPVHPDSDKMIDTIGRNLRFRWNLDQAFIIVPPDQPKVPLQLEYAGESDPGPYPIPDDAPVEGWPLNGVPLNQYQRQGEGDRHVLMLDPAGMKLYELFYAFRTDKGWKAGSAAIFDLTSNKLRPDGWTSADAAGLPLFPAVVRYDECERGMVQHAMRVTFPKTRRAYIYPGTHYASPHKDPLLPRMGERFRLKKDFDISRFPPHVQAILKGLKKYGMIVADNGIEWAISVAPDTRIKGLETLDHKAVKGNDFEVIVTTGPEEGPRARK